MNQAKIRYPIYGWGILRILQKVFSLADILFTMDNIENTKINLCMFMMLFINVSLIKIATVTQVVCINLRIYNKEGSSQVFKKLLVTRYSSWVSHHTPGELKLKFIIHYINGSDLCHHHKLAVIYKMKMMNTLSLHYIKNIRIQSSSCHGHSCQANIVLV